MKVEVDVLGSPSLIVRRVSKDVKQLLKKKKRHTSELRSCVKVEVEVLIVRTFSVDVQQHLKKKKKTHTSELRSCVKSEVNVLIVRAVSVDVEQHLKKFQPRAQELCESRGGRPDCPYGLC